ncbi:MAG: glutaminase [Granulosicoccus sp.]
MQAESSLSLQELLTEIAESVKPLTGKGQVASYIPALARVNPEQFGMAVHTVDGQSFSTGDATTGFSIQSISKVLSLTLAIEHHGRKLWQRVGREPSGDPFNSLVQLEHERGVPRNPLINAGAILVADALLEAFDEPVEQLLTLIEQQTDERPLIDVDVAASEKATGFRNEAMANLMKSFGNLKHPVEDVLDVYFNQCSIVLNCEQLSKLFAFLANDGKQPLTDTSVISARRARRINALMLTCGTYDRAGEFAFEVGLPAKSGVGGGITAVVPGRMAICAWSPALGESGNSIAATEALRLFAERTGSSVF